MERVSKYKGSMWEVYEEYKVCVEKEKVKGRESKRKL